VRLREQSRRHELAVPVQIVTNNDGMKVALAGQ